MCIPLSLVLYEAPSLYRATLSGAEAATSRRRDRTASSSPLPTRNASVAIVLAGDARTLLCPEAAESFNEAVLDPLLGANYSVHVFAFIKPTVYYGRGSPWIQFKSKECEDTDTPFTNMSKSFVSPEAVEDAVARLSATSRAVRVADEATATASYAASLEERAESVGCADALRNSTRNRNETAGLIGNGYAHYSQWKTVHDGYVMMEEAESRAGERFEYVARLRPDTRPLMASIVNDGGKLPLSSSDPTAITKFGDGHAIMPRASSGDAYFNAYKIYSRFCDEHERLRGRVGSADQYFEVHVREHDGRGLELVDDKNFTFWFRRPRTCTQLCKEKILGYL